MMKKKEDDKENEDERQRPMPSIKFVDESEIEVRAAHGNKQSIDVLVCDRCM